MVGEEDLAWLWRAASASVLDLRGARFDSVVVDGGCSAGSGSFSESESIGFEPSTRIFRDEVKVVKGSLVKSDGKVLEPACDGLSALNLGDLPRRAGVPRGDMAVGEPCMSRGAAAGFQEKFKVFFSAFQRSQC